MGGWKSFWIKHLKPNWRKLWLTAAPPLFTRAEKLQDCDRHMKSEHTHDAELNLFAHLCKRYMSTETFKCAAHAHKDTAAAGEVEDEAQTQCYKSTGTKRWRNEKERIPPPPPLWQSALWDKLTTDDLFLPNFTFSSGTWRNFIASLQSLK